MMRWIIGTSIRLQYLVIVLAVVMLVYGGIQLQEMPVDVFPEFDPPMVEVQTEALGLSAIEMEALLTVPLEADLLNGVAWLESIESETVTGLSSILLTFEPGTDPIQARQMVQERLTQTFALPNVSTPPTMLQPLSSSSRVMIVGLSSEDVSLIDMSVLARWVIKPRLMGVPGVANVAIWGQREWQLQVQVDPEELGAADVSLQQVIETAGEAIWVSPLSYLESSSPGTAGWIDTPNQRLGIQHLLPISAAEDLAQVPVAGSEELLLGDISEVVEDHQQLIGDALLSDGPGLMLVIEKFPSASTVEVTQGVEEALAAMAPGLTGIEVDTTLFRPANYVELASKNLSSMATIAFVLVAIALVAFYMGWRNLLISLIAIPLSLVIAALVMYLRGATMNAVLLAGLVMALAVIVDDAIIDVENIARRLRERDADTSAGSVIVEAMMEVRGPLWFALICIVLTVVPIFFIQGLTGTFLQPLVVTYVIAIFSSLAVALIVTPALSLVLLSNVRGGGDPALISSLRDSYKGILSGFVGASTMAIAVAVVLAVVGLSTIFVIRQELVPSFKQTDLRILWEGAPSTSVDAMLRVTTRISDELLALDGVENVGSHVGRAITGDQIVNVNSGDIWVSISPDAKYDDTRAAIEEIVNGYPGLFRTVETYTPDNLDEVVGLTGQQVTVRIYGHELDVLTNLANETAETLSGISGLSDIEPEHYIEEPQIEIQVDLDAAEQHQIKPGDVRRAATTLISGLTVGNLYEENKVFEVVVWSKSELRDSMSDINNLLIDTPTGHVPLSALADIRIVPSPIVIQRDAVQRYIDVDMTVEGSNVNAVVEDINSAILDIDVPLEYHMTVLMTSGQTQGKQQSMYMLLAAILVGIFLLLQASLQSWRLALISLLMLPVAISGGLVAIWIGGGIASLGSLFGLLAILGVALRNIIVMFNRMNEADTTSENVLTAAGERMGSGVMAAFTTILALMPIVVSGNTAGTEILHPMAITILGGLITTTLLSLFILPALYLSFGSGTRAAESS